MFMNTLAKYTQQPNKENNINFTIHSPHPFEVNENLNSTDSLLTEEIQDSPMDLSTSKPCHSVVDEEPSSSEHSQQLVSELQKEIEKLTAQLEKMNAEYVSLKKEFAMYCQNSDKWMRVYTSLSTAKSFEILFKAIHKQ
jgi:molecular chaperone GrpE (heat shock protein)